MTWGKLFFEGVKKTPPQPLPTRGRGLQDASAVSRNDPNEKRVRRRSCDTRGRSGSAPPLVGRGWGGVFSPPQKIFPPPHPRPPNLCLHYPRPAIGYTGERHRRGGTGAWGWAQTHVWPRGAVQKMVSLSSATMARRACAAHTEDPATGFGANAGTFRDAAAVKAFVRITEKGCRCASPEGPELHGADH